MPASNDIDIFACEGETLRVKSLGPDSGARECLSRKAKWVLDRRTYNGRWERDSHTFLDNSATVADAKRQFGF